MKEVLARHCSSFSQNPQGGCGAGGMDRLVAGKLGSPSMSGKGNPVLVCGQTLLCYPGSMEQCCPVEPVDTNMAASGILAPEVSSHTSSAKPSPPCPCHTPGGGHQCTPVHRFSRLRLYISWWCIAVPSRVEHFSPPSKEGGLEDLILRFSGPCPGRNNCWGKDSPQWTACTLG